ncbi:hypothetical protein KUW09_15335 [Mameliella alba]|nr:hypothetical protein [Antarctobacter heliothermus]MBY6145426.1 hypothetical protein [Mameliella alba]MBY6162237.1 hypothetical protein [Mameliella alba]MBY6170706.1 hypothetical protein [Mameliella alba]MBY6175724.1 hypothetical protein [Mameliella alba]
MFRRALRIWLMHSLAFVAGLVVSGVVAVGLWSLVPKETGIGILTGSAFAVSIVAVGIGYAIYLALIAALLDVMPGWGFYLGGPLLVLAVMLLVFLAVYLGVLAAGFGSLLGYAMLYLVGGGVVHRLLWQETNVSEARGAS